MPLRLADSVAGQATSVENPDSVMADLRAEWRRTIADIDDHIRRMDANHRVHMLDQDAGEAARHWRFVLVNWRDELMSMLRQYPAPPA